MPADPRLNTGVIIKSAGRKTAPAERTLIVSGVARSGTSMIAAMLAQAGVFIGEILHEVVLEDAEALELLRQRNRNGLRDLIARRDAAHRTWGFKLPNLHAYLRHDELPLFRNPHLILIFRDPVAAAVRSAVAEHYDVLETLVNVGNAQQGLVQFMLRANCPSLLLSYEKLLVTPHAAIDALLAFCGIGVTSRQRTAMLAEIRPNAPDYLAISSSSFEGCIDGIRNGELVGWCRQVERIDPVQVDVLANGVLLQTVLANRFREDLADLGMGNGCHGFTCDLQPYNLPPGTVLRARIRDRILELSGSGETIAKLSKG